jgi:nucleoid-associated protein YgaU
VLDTPTTEPLRVVVRKGESMWEFAERVYGDGREWKRIWRANNFLLPDPNNPDLIHPGQEFLIPPLPASH